MNKPMSPNSLEAANADTAPLVDWTPEQQIAHMLELCEAQMESAICESDLAVDSLIKAFSGLAESAQSLSAVAAKLTPEARRLLTSSLKHFSVSGVQRSGDFVSQALADMDRVEHGLELVEAHDRAVVGVAHAAVGSRTARAPPRRWR